MSVIPRLNRLFAADGKCFEVALDHGAHNEPSFLAGMENLEAVVKTVAAAEPDAILLNMGQAHWLQDRVGKAKPATSFCITLADRWARRRCAFAHHTIFSTRS